MREVLAGHFRRSTLCPVGTFPSLYCNLGGEYTKPHPAWKLPGRVLKKYLKGVNFMAEKYILAMDPGTTGSRTIIFDKSGSIVSQVSQEFPQIFPQPGWVEHDPEAIWESQIGTAKKALEKASLSPGDIAAIGITNQRETTVIWDKNTGQPVHNAIVWGCRRSAPQCERLIADGWVDKIRQKTGLVIDAYFSATKITWILENVPGVRERAEKGDLLFGNIDTWLMWKLTGGKVHATDYSNASRTMLFNIHDLKWDKEILDKLEIPPSMLPEVKPSSGIFGYTDEKILGAKIPIAGDAGDQQAALFGQACYKPGLAKNTFGTAGVMEMNTGEKPLYKEGLTTTIAWGINGKIEYALEGVVFTAGATIQWLRDGLKLIHESKDTEYYASQVEDTGGVYLVPAFVGLCAPYWDMYARGILVGITRGTNRKHVIRAAIEAMAYQTKDIVEAMVQGGDIELSELRVDGGAVQNNLLCQFQADILGVPVIRPVITEMTALGAAYLAGLGVGYWKDQEEISSQWQIDKVFTPQMSADRREQLYAGWKKAVERSRSWAV